MFGGVGGVVVGGVVGVVGVVVVGDGADLVGDVMVAVENSTTTFLLLIDCYWRC